MRLGFVSCVKLGLSCMEAIHEVGGRLDLALTLHDTQAVTKSGRVYLDAFCAAHDVPLVKVRNINDDDALAALRAAELDWLFIIGWSQIARKPVLDTPRLGVLGMHPTLLPEGRGRAAIPWAILKGLDRTGVTLFKLDEGVDTGDILEQAEIRLSPNIDAGVLYEAMDATHVELIRRALPGLLAGELMPRPQDEARATVWPARGPEDGRIDLGGSVFEAERLVRAVTRPYPGAFVERDGRRTIVWRARIASAQESAASSCLNFPDGALLMIESQDVGA